MSTPIAIVGMGCVVPGAGDVRTFWENVRAGRQSLIPVPATAWDHGLYFSPDPSEPDRAYAELGGFVTDFVFDWRRFRVPPTDAAEVNPMQWMVLEAGAQALGSVSELPRESTAIILGATGLGWQKDSGFRIRLDEMLDAVRESPEFRRDPSGDAGRGPRAHRQPPPCAAEGGFGGQRGGCLGERRRRTHQHALRSEGAALLGRRRLRVVPGGAGFGGARAP